jgi:arylsulfatase A-like enzyme
MIKQFYFLVVLGLFFLQWMYGKSQENLKNPNFILIYVDDLGWTDTSVAMVLGNEDSKSDFYQTPFLEAFSKEGLVFSSAYSPAPVCTPSRNSMLHGMTPANLWNSVLFDERAVKNYRGVITIPQALKQANENYRSAHFGKWHISAIKPKVAGFDVTDGPTGNGEGDYMDDMKTHLPEEDPKRMIELTDKTIQFMENQVENDRPFFVQLSHYAVHIWHDSKAETREKYRNLPWGIKSMPIDYIPEDQVTENAFKHNWLLNYAAMIEEIDAEFGRLLKRVEELGIKDNTYVIFTSDNGGGLRGNKPLQGAKGDLAEGGIRVPFIVCGPKVLKSEYVDKPIVGWDLLPTFYELAGGTSPLPEEIEGGSIKQYLEKGNLGTIKRGKEALVFHFPWYNGEPETAIRLGNMKLLKNLDTGKCQLFDVVADPSESNDLAKRLPEITRNLERDLTQYLVDVDAEDVSSLRKGYLARMENSWLPTETKKVKELRERLKNGDKTVSKEVNRIDGYIEWMNGEILFTKERLIAAGEL